MLSRSIKDVATVHALVVVEEDNITLCHLYKFNILHGDLVQVLQLFIGQVTIISKEHVRFVDLRSTIFETLRSVAVNDMKNKAQQIRIIVRSK